MSPLRFRKRARLGPVRLNITQNGVRSVSLKAGPFTWNPTRRKLTTNLPGGLYHEADLTEPPPAPEPAPRRRWWQR
jgi:hypothetical protein